MLQSNRKAVFSCMWLNLSRKIIFFFEFVPFYWFDQKVLFQKFLILLRIYPFKHVKKNKLSDYFSAPFEIARVWTKKRSSLWIFQKCLKRAEKHHLAICGSLWSEKTENVRDSPHFTSLINKKKFPVNPPWDSVEKRRDHQKFYVGERQFPWSRLFSALYVRGIHREKSDSIRSQLRALGTRTPSLGRCGQGDWL